MLIKDRPEVTTLEDGSKIWENTFNLFKAKVYVPVHNLPDDIINFGLSSPYLIYFAEKELSQEEAIAFAKKSGLESLASKHGTSVVFISPVCGNWKNAPAGLFEEIIAYSKIHEYYKDGYAIINNRFTKQCDGYAIRGAIFKTCVFAKNEAADYVAENLLKPLQGEGLWGPADVTPTVCILENLSVTPKIERRNMPVASVNNSTEINDIISKASDYTYITENSDYASVYNNFAGKFRRWGWVGDLQDEPDFEALNMMEEPGFTTVKTSKDNAPGGFLESDAAGTETHKIGYIAYYNKDLFEKGPAPLVLCFHGGGDSAKHIAQVSQWYKVCHDHNFLLICVENHLNSTATEAIELISHLKEKYNIDSTRIYGTGFSMGGCKSWDLFQEYPDYFAGLAPMSATFDVGQNFSGRPSLGFHGSGKINDSVIVPLFYAGGEQSPLPELPFQEQRVLNRMKYTLTTNKVIKKNDAEFENKENWADKILGISGDKIEQIEDKSRDAILTLNYFNSEDGNCYTVFGSINNQGHECRYHTCENAWKFLSQFSRAENGKIIISK